VGDDARLAGARTGEDQEWPRDRRHGFALGLIEIGEDVFR
jgi:hypothetical protein